MTDTSLQSLWRIARTLSRRARAGKALPPLLFFTDPVRTPDPEATLRALPRGAGVVYRAFGRSDALAEGRRLAALARNRGLVFLVGADWRLAERLHADGVHLPERLIHHAGRIRRAHPDWIVTAAAHAFAAIVRARHSGALAVVISPVFASASPSASRPLGHLRFRGLAQHARLSAYALGGVNARNAKRISGAIGLAAIDALKV